MNSRVHRAAQQPSSAKRFSGDVWRARGRKPGEAWRQRSRAGLASRWQHKASHSRTSVSKGKGFLSAIGSLLCLRWDGSPAPVLGCSQDKAPNDPVKLCKSQHCLLHHPRPSTRERQEIRRNPDLPFFLSKRQISFAGWVPPAVVLESWHCCIAMRWERGTWQDKKVALAIKWLITRLYKVSFMGLKPACPNWLHPSTTSSKPSQSLRLTFTTAPTWRLAAISFCWSQSRNNLKKEDWLSCEDNEAASSNFQLVPPFHQSEECRNALLSI